MNDVIFQYLYIILFNSLVISCWNKSFIYWNINIFFLYKKTYTNFYAYWGLKDLIFLDTLDIYKLLFPKSNCK